VGGQGKGNGRGEGHGLGRGRRGGAGHMPHAQQASATLHSSSSFDEQCPF